jgi:hypothetical protein
MRIALMAPMRTSPQSPTQTWLVGAYLVDAALPDIRRGGATSRRRARPMMPIHLTSSGSSPYYQKTKRRKKKSPQVLRFICFLAALFVK